MNSNFFIKHTPKLNTTITAIHYHRTVACPSVTEHLPIKLQIESQSIDSDIFICFGDKHVNVINPLAVSSLPVNAYDEIIIQSTQPLNDFELSAIETAINDGWLIFLILLMLKRFKRFEHIKFSLQISHVVFAQH